MVIAKPSVSTSLNLPRPPWYSDKLADFPIISQSSRLPQMPAVSGRSSCRGTKSLDAVAAVLPGKLHALIERCLVVK